MRVPPRPLFLLLPVLLLAACRGEEDKRATAAGEPPAALPRQEGDAAAATAGAVLEVEGGIEFHGASPFFCVPHESNGLQVDFRTGDPLLPAVAVRIEDFRGAGPYRARLFLTGRSASGALVTSEGEAEVDLQPQQAQALVRGSFRGSYVGEAGQGSIAGRFGSCSYSAYAGESPPLGPLTAGPGDANAPSGREEQPAGASEETPP